MRFSVMSALAMASTVSGHALMYGVWVDGKDQGDGKNTYIRSPANNSPVKDLTSPDIVCNVNGAKAVDEFVSAAAGSKLTFEWYHNTRTDDIIDGSHKGPIITWIAEYTEGAATGPIWSKIDEAGYDGSKWAVDKLIANEGKYDFTLPASIKAGKYLIRQEIIAHHESDTAYDANPARGAQFYPSCVQFEITGSGTEVPDQGFDFNKDYTYADKGIVFNLYGSYTSYEIPGGSKWVSGSGSGGGAAPTADTPAATSADAPAATTAPASPAVTTAPGAGSPAVPTTLSSVVIAPSNGSGADPVETEPASVPSATAPTTQPTANPSKPGCSKRRRRRRSAKRAL